MRSKCHILVTNLALPFAVPRTADHNPNLQIAIMASVTRSTLPLVITTRLDVSQGKTISVQDFLRSLKRPGSKAQTTKAQLISRNQDGPPSAAVKIDHLQDHAALGEDRPTSLPVKKLPADNPLIPRLHEGFSTKPPQSDTPQKLCSSPLAKSAGSVTEPAVTGLTHSLDAPRGVRTYGRKSKPKLLPTDDLPGSSPLSCAQPSTADQSQIPKDHESTSRVQELENLVELQNDQQGALRVVPSTVEAVIKEPSRKRRKRRRAPVNELALVAELPLHANPPDEESSEQCRAKHKDPYKANVGRPMTKSRRDLVTPRRNSIDPQDFKFPPATPKNARSSGWTPGSGFEGTTLQSLASTTLTPRRRPARRTKTVRFAIPPTSPLDLSTEISPTAKASNSPLSEKALESLALPPEAGRRLQPSNAAQDPSTEYGELIQHTDKAAHTDETISSKIQMLTALMKPRAQVNQLAKSEVLDDGLFRLHSSSRQRCPSRKIDVDSTAIRRPSKSERNGWLKRRKRVSFADQNEQRIPQSAKNGRQSDETDDAEQLFEAHNATWYGKDAQADPCFRESVQGQGWRTPMVRSPQLQAKRSSKSLEMQISQGEHEAESPELGDYPIYPIQDAGLNVGKYFSNAVQKLSSEEKGPHTVVRRKSQIQKLAHGGPSEMEASLELGVTPRLKRTLSSVPFRPPFKSL